MCVCVCVCVCVRERPEGGSGREGTREIDLRVTICDGTTSEGQPQTNILFVSRVDGTKRGGGVSEIHGNRHEDLGLLGVGYEAIVCCLCPSDDGEPGAERGTVVRSICSQLWGVYLMPTICTIIPSHSI